MNRLKLLTGLIPGSGAQVGAAEEDRLLKLYWNRVAVKKELSDLRKERFNLLEKLREQEAATLRVQGQLDSLEKLLAEPQAAATAIVHYQLRQLWRQCAQRIAQFVGELADKQVRREKAHLASEFRRRQRQRLAELDPPCRQLEVELADCTERRKAAQRLLADTPFWRFDRRKALKAQLAGIDGDLAAMEAELQDLTRTRELVGAEPVPEHAGLSTESRRLLNLAALALAQELVLFFSEHDLAARARAAMAEDVRNADFGTAEEAHALSQVIDRRMAALAAQRHLSAAVKQRTDYLRSRVEYRRDAETVPLAQGLDKITLDPARGSRAGVLHVNVLAEEYWDIYKALR